MTRCIYVNGQYRAYADALVHAEDRGFQFGDGVYEVIEVHRGRLIDAERHLTRLKRSLFELKISPPMTGAAMSRVFWEVVRRNRVHDGMVYLQVTRGAAPRDFALPSADHPTTFVCLARSLDPAQVAAKAKIGIGVKTMPEARWNRCDLKTVMLLPSVLAKDAAKAEGAGEAWYVDTAGFVTEGASSNAWIVTSSGELVTRPVGHEILAGVTRATLKDVAAALQLKLVERPFTVAEAIDATEAFLTSATNILMPVVRIDGSPVGAGKPGPVSARLRAAFHDVAMATAV
ncbi:MAG: D-amino-acid transaminase [Hyphomicrobiaceae bacterium]